MNKGNLVTVRHPDGHHSKMYEADAIAAGLMARPKAQPPAPNKMLPAAGNKAAMSADIPAAPAEPDDFTTIPGIGPAAARLLAAHGITTFAALRAATDLSYLSKKAAAAIEAWKND